MVSLRMRQTPLLAIPARGNRCRHRHRSLSADYRSSRCNITQGAASRRDRTFVVGPDPTRWLLLARRQGRYGKQERTGDGKVSNADLEISPIRGGPADRSAGTSQSLKNEH